MPTESSVVASLIRDFNTHRLPSEPGDAFLFQPAPGEQPKQPAYERPRARGTIAPVLAPKPVVTDTAAKTKTPQPAKPRSALKGWLQFTFATLVIAGWGYVATQLESSDEPLTEAALPVPAAPVAMVATPTPAIQPAQPAVAAAPAIEPVQPAAPTAPEPPAVEPTVPTVEAAATPATATVPSAPPAPTKHHHHRVPAKAKRIVKTVKAPAESAEPTAVVPAPPVSAPPARSTTPSKPQQQRDDSEDPLH